MSWKVFAVVPLLLFTSLSARADGPDLTFSNPGTVITAPTDVAVNLVMPGDADRQAVAALLVIEYDPALVTLSNPRAANPTLWNDFSVYSVPDAHQLRVLMLTNGYASGQTTSGPLMYVTVTPVGSSADLSVCPTLRLVGGTYGQELTSHLAIYRPSLNDYDSVYAASSCGPLGPIYQPPGEDGALSDGSGTTDQSGDGSDDPEEMYSSALDISSVVRLLRLAAGLEAAIITGNPNKEEYDDPLDPRLVNGTQDPRFRNGYYLHYSPLTTQDQATVELADDKYWLLPCPTDPCPTSRKDPGYRRFTVADAIVALRIPFSCPLEAIWSMPFQGNWSETTGFAANATGAPALADIDGDTRLDVVFPMGVRNGRNYPDPRQDQPGGGVSTNPNMVYAVTYNPTLHDFTIKNGWPQPLRDAAYGVSVGDILASPGLEVVASNFQDTWRKSDGVRYSPLLSRPYVWTMEGEGTGVFADSDNPDRAVGVGIGHSNTAAPLFDATGDGVPEILFTSQGVYDSLTGGENGGGIKALSAAGSLAFETQETDHTAPWYTGNIPFAGPVKNVAEFNAPPVRMRANGGVGHIVAAGAYSGDLYAWDADGNRLFSVQTDTVIDTQGRNKGKAVIDNAFAAGDVDNDGHDELVVGTGRNLNYYDYDYDTSLRFNDGAIYCWSDTGAFRWRYPASGWRPAFASGIALGRLQGPTAAPSIVAVDSSGYVVALNGATGAEQWHYDIKPLANDTQKYQHLYLQGCIAQPLILDVNNDGYQDVIVGTTSGWIYVLDGNKDATTRVLARTHTFLSAQTVWRPNPETLIDNYVLEAPYEEVVGMAVGPLDPVHTDHAILLVTSSRAATTVEVQPVGGHATLIDLSRLFGSAATWWDSADWPQFQRDAQRTGRYAAP